MATYTIESSLGEEYLDVPDDYDATVLDAIKGHINQCDTRYTLIDVYVNGQKTNPHMLIRCIEHFDNVTLDYITACDLCIGNKDDTVEREEIFGEGVYSISNFKICERQHLNCLRAIYKDDSYKFLNEYIRVSIRAGNLDEFHKCLSLNPNGYRYSRMYSLAADSNRINILEFLHSEGFPWEDDHLINSNVETTEWLIDNYPLKFIEIEAERSIKMCDVDRFKNIINKQNACTEDGKCLAYAISRCHPEIIKLMIEWFDKNKNCVRVYKKKYLDAAAFHLYKILQHGNVKIFRYIVEANIPKFEAILAKDAAEKDNRPDLALYIERAVNKGEWPDTPPRVIESKISFNGVTVPVSIDVDTTIEDIRKVASQTFDPSIPEHRYLLPFVGTSVVCVGGTPYELLSNCRDAIFGFLTLNCLEFVGRLFNEEYTIINVVERKNINKIYTSNYDTIGTSARFGTPFHIMYDEDTLRVINNSHLIYDYERCNDNYYIPRISASDKQESEMPNIISTELGDVDHFFNRLRKYAGVYTDYIRTLMDCGNVTISGSLMSEYVSGLDFSSTHPVGDVDIFISSENTKPLKDFFAKTIDMIREEYYDSHYCTLNKVHIYGQRALDTGDLSSLKIALFSGTTLNFIFSKHYENFESTVTSLVNNFDYTCCMAFTNGKILSYHKHVKERKMEIISNNSFPYDSKLAHRPSRRIAKYTERGFINQNPVSTKKN